MDENNIIVCEKCYEENESSRTTCKYCGAKLYKNDVSNKEYKNSKDLEVNEEEQSEDTWIENTTIKNKIANKFKIVANILKFIGYGGAFIFTIIYMSADEIGFAILGAIVIVIATWFSCLFWEAISEVLQLLEDIKNK